MIVPAGVLVPADVCALVSAILAAHIRRTYTTDIGLARVAMETGQVADSAAVSAVSSTDDGAAATMTARQYSTATGTPRRTVTAWCQANRLPGGATARKDAGRWVISMKQPQPLRASPDEPPST